MTRSTPVSTQVPALLRHKLALSIAIVCANPWAALQAAPDLEEVQIIGVAPGSAIGQRATRLPFAVKSINFTSLQNSQSLDLTDYLNSQVGSVNINSAQNNPLQSDVQFRGFTASPLLGLPQGIAVYQNGVRINEPLGDAVNWDLLPESAIYSMDLISGANPVFGLNTLGGALAIKMKDGFNFTNNQVEVQSGSWGRNTLTVESGNNAVSANGNSWGYYVNASGFEENGWRDLSDSKAQNFYGSLSWRNTNNSSLDLSYQHATSDLTGNGSLPVGLLAIDRSAVFTAPDTTENNMQALTLQGSTALNSNNTLSGTVFWRQNKTNSLNGDGSELGLCNFSGGGQALFDQAEDIEAAVESQLDLDFEGLCEGDDPAFSNVAELQNYLNSNAMANGLDPEDFRIEDITDDLYGSGILSDEAVNNLSNRKQQSRGFTLQNAFSGDLFSHQNQLVVGISYFDGKANFNAVTELAFLDPLTRSTQGLNTGTFYRDAETNVRTSTRTASLYFVDTFDLSDKLAVILAGRYNNTDISLRDRSGERPELNGDHNFARFNPSLGFTYNASANTNFYGSYSQSNRVPTPIELACNEGVFEVARQYAIAAGENPDDIEFECRLPNAFLADPPLDAVVTENVELGIRGQFNEVTYQLGYFVATNHDDILFQTTGRATGLFANVDKTRRRGIESSLQGNIAHLSWYANWTWLEARFEDGFLVLSPNHPNADSEGELQVQRGDRIPGIPEHLLKLGGSFEVSNTLRLGAELIYNSDQVIRGDESNDMDTVPAYTLLNLRASYQPSEALTLFVRITNVLDKNYENFGMLGEDPSEIMPGLQNTSARFVGVGAPRAAWAGLRYQF